MWRMRKKSVDNAVPKSTSYKTKWSCRVFEEWKLNRLMKSCTLEPSGLFTAKDFEERVQTLDTAITDMHFDSQNIHWSKGLFGQSSVRSLLNTVYFHNGMLFGLQASEHRSITSANIRVFDDFIKFDENGSKTFQDGICDSKSIVTSE